MNRRGFLGAILASAAAPAFVRSGILMPVRQPISVPGDLEFIAASEKMLAGMPSLLTTSARVSVGDVFTIAGVASRGRVAKPSRFVVTAVSDGGVLEISSS